jgi:Xaa-Pro aminopeptidase
MTRALASPLDTDGRLFVPLGDRAKDLGAEIDGRGLAALLLTSPESVYYVTGYTTLPSAGNPILYALRNRLPPYALVEPDGSITLGCWGFSVEGVDLRVDRVAAFNSFATAREGLVREVGRRVGADGRLGVESSCPLFVVKALEAVSADRLVPADEVVSRLRLIKSPTEIGHLTRSLHIAETTVGELLDDLALGASRLEVMAAAQDSLHAHGADGVGHVTITFGETNPEIALDERLEEGRLAVLDVGAIVAGYRSDNRRYAYAGSPSAALLEQHAAMVEIVEAVGQALVPGAPYRDVHERAVRLFADAGIPLLARFSHAGHHIGLETEEQWIDETTADVVEPGMVINIELYSLTDTNEQIGDEETYVIDDTGPHRISQLSTDLRSVT